MTTVADRSQLYMLRTNLLLQKLEREITINTGNRVMVLALCTSSHYRLSVLQVSFIYLQYYRNMLHTKLLLQKLGREITVMTCDSVMVLSPCTSSDDILLIYQVVLNYLLYFHRYAVDKLDIANLGRKVTP